MDAEWNDPDDGWVNEFDYQPQGPFFSQQALEAHREFLDRGARTSSVGLAAGPPAGPSEWQIEIDSAAHAASVADSEGYDFEAEYEAEKEEEFRQLGSWQHRSTRSRS